LANNDGVGTMIFALPGPLWHIFLGGIKNRMLYLVAYFRSLFRQDGLGHAYIRLAAKVAELLQTESRFGVSRCQWLVHVGQDVLLVTSIPSYFTISDSHVLFCNAVYLFLFGWNISRIYM
jgi:hypothetical protein